MGLLLPNGIDFVVAFLAAARIGAVAAPFSTLSSSRELRWLLDHGDIEILVTADRYRNHDYLDRLEEAVPAASMASVPRSRLPNLFGVSETLGTHSGLPHDVVLDEGDEGFSGPPVPGMEVEARDPVTHAPVGRTAAGKVRKDELRRLVEARLGDGSAPRRHAGATTHPGGPG